MRRVFCLSALVLTLSAIAVSADAGLEARRKALNDLLQEQWEYTMLHNPIYASSLGDKRYNDQLDDFSQQAIDEDLEQTRRFVTRFCLVHRGDIDVRVDFDQQITLLDTLPFMDGQLNDFPAHLRADGDLDHRLDLAVGYDCLSDVAPRDLFGLHNNRRRAFSKNQHPSQNNERHYYGEKNENFAVPARNFRRARPLNHWRNGIHLNLY